MIAKLAMEANWKPWKAPDIVKGEVVAGDPATLEVLDWEDKPTGW